MLPVRVEDVHRIAVLRANGIGDYIVSIPALTALRAAYADAELVLLGLPWHAGFLTGRPGPIDRVVVLPRVHGITANGSRADSRRVDRFVEWMRAQRLDLAIQLHGGGRYSNPFVRSLGARVSVGLRTPDAEPLDLWVRYTYYQHEALRFLEAVALVGATPPNGIAPRIAVTDRDRAEIIRLGPLPPRLIALHPGARDARRRWPTARFAQVGDALVDAGYSVIVTGAESDRSAVTDVVRRMRAPARSLIGAVGIGGLAGLYQRCTLVIANDTGPRHLAEAVGVPTVGIYWCGNLVNAGPLFRRTQQPLISWTTTCPVCGVNCVRADADAERCAHDVSFVTDVETTQVLAAAEELLTTADEPVLT